VPPAFNYENLTAAKREYRRKAEKTTDMGGGSPFVHWKHLIFMRMCNIDIGLGEWGHSFVQCLS